MPKQAKELSPIEIKRLERPGMHAVGGVAGLLLRISPTGAKSWILRVKIGDRRRDIGLGGYPTVSIAQAREKARDKRELIEQGVDPVLERQKAKEALRAEQRRRITLREIWKDYRDSKLEGLAKKTRQHWEGTMNNHALPVIGDMIVEDITKHHIKEVLDPIWTSKPVVGKKLRQRLESVLDYAKGVGYRDGDNPAAWAGNLEPVMAKPSTVHKVQHFRALPLEDAPAFFAALRSREGSAARALEFTILTACRSGEARGAVWSEIDLKKGLWTIPAERMKMDRSHVVALSPAAIALLKALPRDEDLVFPAPRGGMLSDMSLLAVLGRMGYRDRTTVHGFRSVFKVFADERTDFQDFISEMCLAHYVSEEVKKAYKRSTVVAKRLELMTRWADFLTAQSSPPLSGK